MQRGYTLIEMMVVLVIMGVVAIMGYYGLRSVGDNERLANAQKELVSALRSAQNNAIAGANNGIMNPFTKATYTPPVGVDVSDFGTICFFNPNVDPSVVSCGANTGYWTDNTADPSEIIITLTSSGGNIRQIRVTGSGTKVNSIYAL